MTPDQAFRDARDGLMRAARDLDAARAAFRWPALEQFNWTTHWFDPFATGNRREALRIVGDSDTVERVTFDELADRSRRVARYLHDAGVARGDPMLVMLTNVAPLWETVLAAMRLGAIVIPATTQLTPDDIDDRIARGGVRHVITDAAGAAKVARAHHEGLRVKLLVSAERTDSADSGGRAGSGSSDANHAHDAAARGSDASHADDAGARVSALQFAPFDDARAAPARIDQAPTRADDPLLLYFTSGSCPATTSRSSMPRAARVTKARSRCGCHRVRSARVRAPCRRRARRQRFLVRRLKQMSVRCLFARRSIDE